MFDLDSDCVLPWMKSEGLTSEEKRALCADHLSKVKCDKKLSVWHALIAWMGERELAWPLSATRVSQFIKHSASPSAPSMPKYYKSTLAWYRKYLGAPINMDHVILPEPPLPDISSELNIPTSTKASDMIAPPYLLHFEILVLDDSLSSALRYLALACWICSFASLRIQDAQRSRIVRNDRLLCGVTWASKTPQGIGRGHPMRWLTPRDGIMCKCVPTNDLVPECGLETDYLFPDVSSLDLKRSDLSLCDHQATNDKACRIVREILQLEPLALSKQESACFNGHSFKPAMNSYARLIGIPENFGHWRSINDMRERYDRLTDVRQYCQVAKMISRLRNCFRTKDGFSSVFDWNKMELPVEPPVFPSEPEKVLPIGKPFQV